jgi:pantoate--beta-alanine ligase
MQVTTTINEYRKTINQKTNKNSLIGLVATMGALHDGHLSLIKTAKKGCDLVVCSIFVNPTQFNNPEDFKSYPDTIENDIKLLEQVDCDLLFLPSEAEIYPKNIKLNHYFLNELDVLFEGEKRPGHFNGVCNVVHRLFDIIKPQKAYFGKKDFQQLAIVKYMTESLSLNVEIVGCTTEREVNGLAKSSRNLLLSKNAKEKAGIIYKSMAQAKDNLGKVNILELIQTAKNNIKTLPNSEIEYVDIAEVSSIKPVNKFTGNQKLVMLVAVSVENVRLIDNLMLNE